MNFSIADVPGVLAGHAQDDAALTGCTVILAPEGAVGAVDVRGGAPGTRETDLLSPMATVEVVHAVALCGGSAFGLAAATGVVQWLAERGIGFPTGVRPVPIVPAAVIFDLAIGSADRFADAAMGYAACEAAGSTVREDASASALAQPSAKSAHAIRYEIRRRRVERASGGWNDGGSAGGLQRLWRCVRRAQWSPAGGSARR